MFESILNIVNKIRYKPTSDMAGLTVVIFGASGKVGSILLNYFLDKGANLAIFARDITKINSLLNKSNSTNILIYSGDVCDEKQVNKFLSLVNQKFKSIDAIINTVGLFNQKLITEITEKTIDTMYNSNFKSIVIPSIVALPLLKSGSTIINFGSYIVKNKKVGHGKSLYLAFKTAVESFNKVLTDEAKIKGIRVICLEPATISNFITKDFLNYINPYTIAEMIEFILKFKNIDFGVMPFKSIKQKI